MTRIEIRDGILKIEILGWDKVWAFKSRLEFSLGHVVEARRWEKARDCFTWGTIRAPGTSLPGVIVAGTYHRREQGVWRHLFYDVHKFNRAIVIELTQEKYARVVVEVEDPGAALSLIADSIEPAALAH